jgi:hypothetical protein
MRHDREPAIGGMTTRTGMTRAHPTSWQAFSVGPWTSRELIRDGKEAQEAEVEVL